MSSIAKKPRSVKRQKGTKKPPRFTIKKDSLGRRYALDKRTGKRASISKAEKERASRKKISVTFRGITDKKRSRAAKKGWETRQRNKRSEAAKRGWETKRKKVIRKTIIGKPVTAKELHEHLWGPEIPSFLEQVKLRVLGGIADRSELYPKVQLVTDLAWATLQVDLSREYQARLEGRKESTMNTPRFDRIYGEGHGTHVRYNYFAQAEDLEALDRIIEYLDEAEDNDYVARELYTLYFSPEVA